MIVFLLLSTVSRNNTINNTELGLPKTYDVLYHCHPVLSHGLDILNDIDFSLDLAVSGQNVQSDKCAGSPYPCTETKYQFFKFEVTCIPVNFKYFSKKPSKSYLNISCGICAIPAVYEDWLMGRFDFVSELSQEVDQVQGVRGSMVRPVGVVKLYDRP